MNSIMAKAISKPIGKRQTFLFLAGNIRTYSNGTMGAAWEGSDISTVISRGGIKVGIVGMIGEGQTTSITSKNVARISISTIPKSYAETEASRLRNSEGCDIVILSLHDPIAVPERLGSERTESLLRRRLLRSLPPKRSRVYGERSSLSPRNLQWRRHFSLRTHDERMALPVAPTMNSFPPLPVGPMIAKSFRLNRAISEPRSSPPSLAKPAEPCRDS
jgi:hypothetical protein